ncbi:type II toxin-antitoxin system Phd/YefM family antitoxin [Actinotignum timonense]|uniref:type II toxin-antitoxin system Phd/YefM family antitoxin n=1 Tax=Actinotignum TaxID=1653174 RepID=UPI00254B1CD5|nr:type II toxin-antitoxin system prevent-host-death family antitoxin [Actinotignum timonense]MDK6907386.1 type II toxin-antitoxin system prevent-host-death family antitoxin [Actinotignum timonense]MDK8782796.1 type II toxin-antitoxin system prevent-host-death family antitoxin [Actinotignum timonense]MDY5138762.1 type II toxin-antitoxin system prevent-host-death family antitoxin [Actinotignum timonense]
MRTMNYSESRANYAEVLQAVVDDCEPVIITRSGHESAVIVSLDDYNSMRETAYLMRSPRNARRLIEAMEQIEAGGGTEHPLCDDGE